ncbi:MAG: hypothetical protein KDA21_08100 [Phycisphaerales bacterium]|nr:hypothetical protein [Phycisphaerales bacterium]
MFNRFSNSGTVTALLIAAGAATFSANAIADCQSDYDNCSRACVDANDCPGGCLGCNMGCLIAKVICDWDSFEGSGSFAAFDPQGGHQGAGPIQTFLPGETLVLSVGFYKPDGSDFRYDGRTPFMNPADAGVLEYAAFYRPRSGRDDHHPWIHVQGIVPPTEGQSDTWDVILPMLDSPTSPEGYDLQVHFMMADGSVRIANNVLLPQCIGDTNFDGFVGFDDLNTVLAQYNTVNNGPEQYLAGDVTRDQVVDFNDLNVVLANWGNACY